MESANQAPATNVAASTSDGIAYWGMGIAAVLSALGWFLADGIVTKDSPGSSIAVSLLRTVFTLLPAVAALIFAAHRQKREHRVLTEKLSTLKGTFTQFQRIRRIEHELHTMDRLCKVAREAVKSTATSARELFDAIEMVGDKNVKERLVERYRNHTNNVVTVLAAVGEQLEESGRAIQREVTAEEQIHILERERVNSEKGIALAHELLQQRGITEGLQQLKIAQTRANELQGELSALKSISSEKAIKHDKDRLHKNVAPGPI